MAVNKVVMNTANGEETLIDLTGDTVTADTLAEGVTAHDASGARIVGTMSANQDIYQHNIRFYYNSSGKSFDIVATVYNKSSAAYNARTFHWYIYETTSGKGFIPASGYYRNSSTESVYNVYKICFSGDSEEWLIYTTQLNSSGAPTGKYPSVDQGTFTDIVVKME